MKSYASAYILQNKVTHARLLPTSSAHAFVYPTLSLLLPLSALESHALDLGLGRLFGYSAAGAPRMRVTGIRPEAYLLDYDPTGQQKSIRAKLEDVLGRFGHDAGQLEDAWMMTMPSYLGVEGINPLTVFYCYRKGGDGLWVVVLEVHNTFAERHVYVLQTGSEYEDKHIPPGFDHSWTFPRQFHVSPFNDRSGFYTCSIVAPSHSPSPPLPTVRIHLLTASPSKLKLSATLRSSAAVPLTAPHLFAALARQPFALLLSFPRIAYEAARLHYAKRLDVFARPEPRAVEPGLENATRCRKTAPATAWAGASAGSARARSSKYARRLTERFLEQRARETANRCRTRLHEPDVRSSTISKKLTITFRSSRFFTLLLACPSAPHALLLGRDAERLFITSDARLFTQIFSASTSSAEDTKRPTPPPSNPPHANGCNNTKNPNNDNFTIPPIHPLDTVPLPLPLPLARSARPALNFVCVLLLLALVRLEQALFGALRARFVRGDEPWGAWARAEAAQLRRRQLSRSGADSTEKETEERDEMSDEGEGRWTGSVWRRRK
ncbi:hypothetical protein DFH11DRAFT_1842237 [Phellopilus nigrolimitatus]|nr:hypothetical protein DFH11DRAFT_1842237 [Phellopilus nigrolimitatus]